jgi:hypothetical protein
MIERLRFQVSPSAGHIAWKNRGTSSRYDQLMKKSTQGRAIALQLHYLAGCRPFLSLGDNKLNAVAFVERLEPLAGDSGMMHENVTVSRFTGDESVAFSLIEPLDHTLFLFHSSRTSFVRGALAS